MRLLGSDEEEIFAYRNAAVAAALRTRHLEVSAEQIGSVLLFAGAGILERSHGARATVIEAGKSSKTSIIYLRNGSVLHDANP